MFTMARQCSKNTNLRFQEENKEGRFVNEGDFSLKIFIAKEGNSWESSRAGKGVVGLTRP